MLREKCASLSLELSLIVFLQVCPETKDKYPFPHTNNQYKTWTTEKWLFGLSTNRIIVFFLINGITFLYNFISTLYLLSHELFVLERFHLILVY